MRALAVEKAALYVSDSASRGGGGGSSPGGRSPLVGIPQFRQLGGEGRAEYEAVQLRAVEERGVFGVPTYCFDDARGGARAYWGREHLNLIRLRLYEEGLARPGAAIDSPHVWAGP